MVNITDLEAQISLLNEARLFHEKARALNKEAQIAHMKTQEELLKAEEVLSNAFRAVLEKLGFESYFDYNQLNK